MKLRVGEFGTEQRFNLEACWPGLPNFVERPMFFTSEFCLVYFMKENEIQWIDKFEVFADRLELRWSYDAETVQRPIPEVAAENLKRRELWYKTEP